MPFPRNEEEKANARRFWKKRQIFPSSEYEVIKLFQILEGRFGWEIVYLSSNSFPDAIIEKNGKQLKVEFEYLAKNFLKHGHDPEGCDLIICWFNDWPESPLPVWALINHASYEAYHIRELLSKKYVSRRFYARLFREVRDVFGRVREVLDLDIDDPSWGDPGPKAQFAWMYDVLSNPPKGFVWALGLAAASQGEFDPHSFAWWIKSTLEIRK